MLFGLNIYFMEVSCLRIFLLYLWREYKSKGNRRACSWISETSWTFWTDRTSWSYRTSWTSWTSGG